MKLNQPDLCNPTWSLLKSASITLIVRQNNVYVTAHEDDYVIVNTFYLL
jgi:hypothetical protein